MVHKTAPAGFSMKKLVYGPYSPSRLITAKCPSRFFGQYIRKDKVVGASVNADRGNAIHEVLAKITMANSAGMRVSSKQLSEWVAEGIGKYPASYQQIDLVREAAEAYIGNPSPYANSKTLCEKSFAIQLWEEDTFDSDSIPTQAWVETEYSRGGQAGSFFFGGHIDQFTIDDEIKVITILDHKSTPSANENEDHTFQVGAYAWLVSLFYPGYKIRTVIHYCHPRLNFYAAPVYWAEEDLQEMRAYLVSRVEALEHMQDFPAVPGSGCDYCHMIQECGLYIKVREQKAKGILDMNARSFDDLLRLAKELHVVDAISGEITKALKQGINTLCPENGVDIGGIWYGYKKSDESIDWKTTDNKISEESERAKSKLEEGRCESSEEVSACEKSARYESLDKILISHGLRPDNFKAYNNQKLKNLWALDKPELFEDLKPYLVRDSSTRFGAHKR